VPALTRFLAALERLRTMGTQVLGVSVGYDRKEFEQRGWIKANGYLTHVMVPFLDSEEEVEADIDEAAGVYRYRSPQRRTRLVTRPLADIRLYMVRLDAFFDHLTQLLGIEPSRAARRRCIVPDHLCYLGDRRIQGTHAFAPMFFGRVLNRASAGAIHGALSDPIFERDGIVLALVNAVLPLPNGHRLRPIDDLLVTGEDGAQFDLAALDRVLRGLPADANAEPDEWFDYRTGSLKLTHFERVEKIEGTQLDIIKLFWTVPRSAELEWKDVKVRANSASRTIDDAFGGKPRREHFIEKPRRARYRLRRA
jgi:hypothetical protein